MSISENNGEKTVFVVGQCDLGRIVKFSEGSATEWIELFPNCFVQLRTLAWKPKGE